MIDAALGHWLAGFIDGEGCFLIKSSPTPHGRTYRPVFRIQVRVDDGPLLDELQRATGIGKRRDYSGHVYRDRTNRATAHWDVSSKADVRALEALLLRHPLRSKKARDFEVWRRALDARDRFRLGGDPKAAASINAPVRATLAALDEELREGRMSGLTPEEATL